MHCDAPRPVPSILALPGWPVVVSQLPRTTTLGRRIIRHGPLAAQPDLEKQAHQSFWYLLSPNRRVVTASRLPPVSGRQLDCGSVPRLAPTRRVPLVHFEATAPVPPHAHAKLGMQPSWELCSFAAGVPLIHQCAAELAQVGHLEPPCDPQPFASSRRPVAPIHADAHSLPAKSRLQRNQWLTAQMPLDPDFLLVLARPLAAPPPWSVVVAAAAVVVVDLFVRGDGIPPLDWHRLRPELLVRLAYDRVPPSLPVGYFRLGSRGFPAYE